MFRNRRSSQKPAEEFYAAFRNTYPNVGPGKIITPTAATTESTPQQLSGALSDPVMDNRHFENIDNNKADASTFRASNDDWRLTSSFIDASSFAFASLTNQSSGYCTPSTGGNGTYYHNKAGDLHTPNLGFHLGTPLSLPHSEGRNLTATAFDMHGFHPTFLDPQGFPSSNHFGDPQTFAPSSFLHQDSGFDQIDEPTPRLQTVAGSAVSQQPKISTLPPAMFTSSMQDPASQSKDKFRYQVTLNAPTAMIKHADEIPVTYLNKGQAYAVSVFDTLGLAPSPTPARYRTVVRISFEDQQQRQRPAACWQLWKEGRGLAEAHQRGGKLQAVEYVDPNQGGDVETSRPRVELEKSSFDCFSVTWSPAQGASRVECSVAVRFNFLSTDFSHSKGVKGIPVRLCAKTEILSPGTPDSPPGPVSEVCFCKVKLFRDHGAERKLSNDIAHIKKNIEKHKQQVTQMDSGTKDLGKRKRSGSLAKASGNRPAKVHKHKRTWSISSQGSGGRPALEEDLQMKLATLQNMFGSTRPYSLLYLKGYEDDDPDLYPVVLPGQPPSTITGKTSDGRRRSQDQKASEATSPSNSSASPLSSHSAPAPFHPTGQLEFPNIGLENHVHDDWDAFSQFTNTEVPHMNLASTQNTAGPPVKIERSQHGDGMSQWIETVGIDPSYKAPAERIIRPVACIYALLRNAGGTTSDDCYTAVYLMERTVDELVCKIAQKCDVELNRIDRTVQVNPKGLKIIIDDTVVRELPEGQDMIVEVSETGTELAVKQEQSPSTSLEMRLVF
ncbi:MAG: hypothetical protein LQ337_004253 [Flavoplaca oasis]|nr:MAG: hypothetical protein LQ337_004253 [Flavoplaca oasis]